LHMDRDRGKVAMLESPDLAMKIRRAEAPPRMEDEKGKEAELPTAQGDTLPVPRKDARADIEDEGPEGDRKKSAGAHGPSFAGQRLVVDAAKEGRDAGGENAGRKGFGDEVVGAEAEAFQLVLVGFPGGNDDDGRDARSAEGAEEFEAVHARKPEVEEDEIGRFAHRLEGGLRRNRVDDAVAVAKEVGDDKFGYRRVVLDEKDATAFDWFRHS